MATCKACGHDEHAGRCFWTSAVGGRYVECTCKIRREPKDTDLGVDEEAIAKYQLNQMLMKGGEVIIVKDNGA